MKQLKLLIVILLLVLTYPLHAQDDSQGEEFKGIVSGRIYSNFNYRVNSPNRSTSFALTRAYFGFERQLNEHFSANVKLDVGSPEDLSEFSRINRYAYFKNAGITYKNGGGTV